MDIYRIPCLIRAIGIICLLTNLQVTAGSQSQGGPVTVAAEPLLAGETAAYRGADGLYLLQGGRDASMPMGPRLGNHRVPILSPQLKLLQGQLTAAWIEKLPEGNRIFWVPSPDRGVQVQPSLIAEGTASTALALEQMGSVSMMLDVVLGKTPALCVTPLASDKVSREALPIPDLEELYTLSTLSSGNVLRIFLHGRRSGRDFIGMIDYDTETKKVGSMETVAETPVTPLVQALAITGKPSVLFKVYKEGRFALHLAVRERGAWRISPVTGAEGLDVARLDWQVWPDGRILLVFSGEQREKTKQRVFATLSEDVGIHWRTRQLDSAEFNNTRAWLPRMAVAGDRVAVVWEDARDIRSRVHMQLSMDRGESWLPHDMPLSEQNHYAMRPRIDTTQETLHIAWQQYQSDARDRADLVLQTVSWDEARALASRSKNVPIAQEKQQQLAATLDAFWKAMEENNKDIIYQSYDPFYRARVTLAQHASHTLPMAYYRHEIKDMVIQGNEATTIVLVEISAPNPKDTGDMQSLPHTTYTVQDTWLFIDGRWHRKFVDDLSGGSAIHY